MVGPLIRWPQSLGTVVPAALCRSQMSHAMSLSRSFTASVITGALPHRAHEPYQESSPSLRARSSSSASTATRLQWLLLGVVRWLAPLLLRRLHPTSPGVGLHATSLLVGT
jgi:hypothetical protein